MTPLAASFELFIIETGNGEDSLATCHLLPDAEGYLARILEPHQLAPIEFLDAISSNRYWDCPPWAVSVFPREYRLAGHITSQRIERDDPLYSSFSLIKDPYTYPDQQPPPFSFLWHRSKSMMRRLAGRSPLFKTCWSVLKDKPEDRGWLCFPPPLPEDWVAEAEARDAALFYTHYVPEDVES